MIYINRGSANDASENIKLQSRAIKSKTDDISIASRELVGLSGMEGVIASLSKIESRLEDDSQKMFRMGTALDRIVDYYMRTENRVVDNADGSKVSHKRPNKFEMLPAMVLPLAPGFFSKLHGLHDYFNEKFEASGSVLHGSKSYSSDGMSGSVSGDLLYGKVETHNKVSWGFNDKDEKFSLKSFELSGDVEASGALAKGEAEGNIGLLYGKASGEVGSGKVSGEVKATFYDDGEFNPSLILEGKAEVSAASGEIEVGVGNDDYGISGSASGDVLHAEAEGKVGVGYLGTDDDGDAQYGATAKASAMASVAEGKLEGEFSFAGIKVKTTAKAYVGAAGVEGEVTLTNDGFKVDAGAAALIGPGIEVDVDWSEAEWIGDTIDTVVDFADGVTDYISEAFDWFE